MRRSIGSSILNRVKNRKNACKRIENARNETHATPK
jgi:ribosomal protein S30